MSQFRGDYGWERNGGLMTREGVNLMLQEVLKRMKAMDERLMVIEAARLGQVKRRCEKRDEMKATPTESKKLIAPLQMPREGGNYFEYVEAFVEWVSQLQMSEEEQIERFVEGLKNQNHKLISVLQPRTLQRAILYGRALTTDVDLEATNLDWTSNVMESRKSNEMQKEGKSHVKATGDEDESVDQPMAEEFEFQVEGSRLIDIPVNSPYNNKDKEVLGDNAKLEIQIRVDKDREILFIRYRGIRMTKEDLIKNLGTMARSGALAIVEKLQTSGDFSLSGQLGVGFYSVHLVADSVEVNSEHNCDKQHVWRSKADGVFAISEDTWQEPLVRGTEIRLHLGEEAVKYSFGHKYIGKCLHSINLEPRGDGNSTEEEWILEGGVDLNPIVSLQGLYEVYMLPRSRTMKMTGYYKKMRLIVWMDSDSTHNFVDAALVRLVNAPFVIAYALIRTQAGYVGEDVESILHHILTVADYKFADAQQGSFDCVTRLEMNKNDREDGMETELVTEMSNPTVENENPEVNRIGYHYHVAGEDMVDFSNVGGVESKKGVASIISEFILSFGLALKNSVHRATAEIPEGSRLDAKTLFSRFSWLHSNFEVKRLTSAEDSSDSASTLILATREGFAEEIFALPVTISRAGKLTARLVFILDAILHKTRVNVFHDVERTRLQVLAFQLTEKLSVLADSNEWAMEVRVGGIGKFTDFFLSEPNNIFTEFSTEFVARVWDVEGASVKALVGNQTSNDIRKLDESIKMPKHKNDHREELALNGLVAPLDVDIKGGGRVVVLNSKDPSLVGEVGFGANLMMIEGSAMCFPGVSCYLILQVTYTLKDSGHVQIVGIGGTRVLVTIVKGGQLVSTSLSIKDEKVQTPDCILDRKMFKRGKVTELHP